jgi:hypothetical protein
MAGMARTDDRPAGPPRRTVIGTLDAVRLASVDPRGLVQLDAERWSLDWWIGAEDRWYVPADEPLGAKGVRQALVGSAPVIESRLRVPGGDAVHRAYAARDAGGVPVVVVEVENATSVPFAVALAVRPHGLDGRGRVTQVSAEGTEVRVDGRLVLVAAKAPGRRVAGSGDDPSVRDIVLGGQAQPEAAVAARSSAGHAEAALVFPLAHTATLRVVLPLEGGPFDVSALPSASQVASGWLAHARRGARIEVPDPRLQAAVDSNISHLLLRPHGARVAAALDRFGFHEEAAATLLGDPTVTESSVEPGEALLALTAHWTLTRDQAFADAAAPIIARLVAKLGESKSPSDLALGAVATTAAAGMLETAGEARGAEDVRTAGVAMARSAQGARPPTTSGTDAFGKVQEMLRIASTTWTWAGPEDGHDPVVSAAVIVGARMLLVSETDAKQVGLVLSPGVPRSWFGQGWEVHDLPTAGGRLSYAVRWHDERAALLWELQPHDDAPVQMTAPLLDPSWSTTEVRGEALLTPPPG